MSPATDEVKSTIGYLIPTSRINRRFWAPGKEYNTGIYASYEVTIRNARLGAPSPSTNTAFVLGLITRTSPIGSTRMVRTLHTLRRSVKSRSGSRELVSPYRWAG